MSGNCALRDGVSWMHVHMYLTVSAYKDACLCLQKALHFSSVLGPKDAVGSVELGRAILVVSKQPR